MNEHLFYPFDKGIRDLESLLTVLAEATIEGIVERHWFTENGLHLKLTDQQIRAEQDYDTQMDALRAEIRQRLLDGEPMDDLNDRLLSWMTDNPRMRRPVVMMTLEERMSEGAI